MFCSPRALAFGYGCAVYAEIDLGAGDVEIDVIRITSIMSAQYTGHLVYKRATGQLMLCVHILGSDRGVLNSFLLEIMFRSLKALTFGYGCAVYVGVDVGAGDAEVDVIYIPSIMSA